MLANDPTGQLAREGVAEFHPKWNASAWCALPGRTVVAATAAGGVGGACWPVRE